MLKRKLREILWTTPAGFLGIWCSSWSTAEQVVSLECGIGKMGTWSWQVVSNNVGFDTKSYTQEKTMAECVLLRPDFVLELHTPEDKERFMRVSYFSDDTELILQFPPGSNYYMTLWDEPPSFSTVRKVQDRLYRDPSIDVISLQVIFSNNLEDDFYIIISLCLLLQLIDKLARRGESQTFPWEEWGPNITRWIPSILFAPEPRAVSGSRICVTTDNLRFTHGSDILQDILPGDGYYCSVLDFNSRAVKQGLSLQDDTAFSCSLITDGWIFYHPDLSTKVMSSLPFRHFISKKPAMDNLPLEMEMWAVGDVAYMIQVITSQKNRMYIC